MSATYRAVLCPTDLSASGDAAVALAYRIVADGGVVHLLHIAEPSFLVLPFDLAPVMVTPTSAETLAAYEKHATEHLNALAPQPSARGVRTETHLVNDLGPSGVIQREAKNVRADAIVMGTHGRSGIRKLMMGSVAADVLNHAPIPVILLRQPHAKP